MYFIAHYLAWKYSHGQVLLDGRLYYISVNAESKIHLILYRLSSFSSPKDQLFFSSHWNINGTKGPWSTFRYAQCPSVHLVTLDTLWNSTLTDPCELDLDMGTQCKENEVKWFFDKTDKICTQIWYGGCGGNANRFDTEAECISRCQKTCKYQTQGNWSTVYPSFKITLFFQQALYLTATWDKMKDSNFFFHSNLCFFCMKAWKTFIAITLQPSSSTGQDIKLLVQNNNFKLLLGWRLH